MSFLVRCAALAALLAVAALASGCGDTVIDEEKTADAIEQNVEQELGKQVSAVECPEGVEVKVDATFDCTVTLADGGRETATLKILNEDADAEFVDLKPRK